MPAPQVIFRSSNNAGWFRAFSVQLDVDRTPPWSGLPVYAAGTAYQKTTPASCAVAPTGDLYVADPTGPDATWTGATTFAADHANGRWLAVGSVKAYAWAPYDLTGCSLAMALKPTADGVTLTSNVPVLSASTEPGDGLAINNAAAGGIIIDLPLGKTRAVAAGLYAFDIIATHADERRVRVAFGLWAVDQGISG